MSQLVCPLCGRFVSLAHFNPTGFDNDIYAVEVTGLGRGKGVKVTGMTSILTLGDPTVEMIKDRLLDLCKLFLDEGVLKRDELLRELKVETVSRGQVHKLESEVEVLEVELEDAEKERNRLRGQVETLRRELEEREAVLNNVIDDVSEMIESIEETVGISYEDAEEDPIETLKGRVEDLISEFEVLRAGAEQYE